MEGKNKQTMKTTSSSKMYKTIYKNGVCKRK